MYFIINTEVELSNVFLQRKVNKKDAEVKQKQYKVNKIWESIQYHKLIAAYHVVVC